jgi:hypothetical protein
MERIYGDGFVDVYRVHCPDCGVKREKVPLLPGKAPFSKWFEDAVGAAVWAGSQHRASHRCEIPGAMESVAATPGAAPDGRG